MNTHNLKLAVLSLLISLVSFSSNRRSDVMFPDKETILIEDYANYDNFFQLPHWISVTKVSKTKSI